MYSFPNSMKGLNYNQLGEKVAILMRTKDRPLLLVRALASVLNQTYKEWHLYIVNDGGNSQILEDTIANFKISLQNRLTIIHNETSLGMEAASNCALKIANGDFIAVHDDDDCWHPNFLSACVVFLRKPENKNYAGVITNCELVSEEIIEDKIIEKKREKWEIFTDFILYSNLFSHNIAPPITFLIRHDAVKAAGCFNENLAVLGDWDYILRIMQIGDIGTINQCLAYYHCRVPSQLSDSYQNSVVSGVFKHHLYNTIYTNSLIRESINKNPELVGVFRALSLSNENINNEIKLLKLRINELEDNIMKEIKFKRKSILSKIKFFLKNKK